MLTASRDFSLLTKTDFILDSDISFPDWWRLALTYTATKQMTSSLFRCNRSPLLIIILSIILRTVFINVVKDDLCDAYSSWNVSRL
jgi:hypothetical protein